MKSFLGDLDATADVKRALRVYFEFEPQHPGIVAASDKCSFMAHPEPLGSEHEVFYSIELDVYYWVERTATAVAIIHCYRHNE